MKYIVFDVREVLKNSRIGYVHITSNPLNIFRNTVHPNFILLKTESFNSEGSFTGRLSDDTLFLSTGSSGKVTVLEGNICLFEPDAYFSTLRTGWICQIDVNKIKEENPRSKSFFVLSDKPGPKEWKKASFDSDGIIDFGEDPIKGIALVESFDKLT